MKIRFTKTLLTLTLSGLCMTMLGTALVSCDSDDTDADSSNYTITLDKEDERLAEKETLVVTPSFSDPKAAELGYGWLSMNLDVAKVEQNANGTATVTAISAGTAQIKMVCKTNPKLFATFDVEVFARTVALDKTEEAIFKGQSFVITPTFGGTGTAALKYTWTTSDDKIASITPGAINTVTVKGESVGKATVTITCDTDPDLTASCEVEVNAYTITLTPNGGTFRKNSTLEITPTFNDPGAEAFTYTWTSDKPVVATVASGTGKKGIVTGVADGTAKITITCTTDPDITASCNVAVETYSVTLDKTDEEIENKTTLTITPTFTPTAAGDLAYTWSSSDTGIATVTKNSNGTVTVTGVSAGETTIIIKADVDPTVTASCKVTVTPATGLPFAFDKLYIDGTAIGAKTEVQVTLENSDLFAWYGELVEGKLSIPAELDAETTYVIPADGVAEFASDTAGAVENAKMSEAAVEWTIPAEGKYRIVINKVNKTMAVYSPEIDLQPKTVSWVVGETTTTVPVTDFYHLGESWGWSANASTLGGYVQSAADPQVLIWNQTGTAGKGSAQWGNQRVKFVVWCDPELGVNPIYTFSCPKTELGATQNLRFNLKETKPLEGGYDSVIRECWYNFNANVFVNFFIVDVRNMTVYADFRE